MLAGIFVLLLQGTSAGHMLLVEHTQCAEHGELVHGTHEHAGTVHEAASGPVLRGTSDADAESAHDHCLLAADRRDAIASVIQAQVTAARLCDAPLGFAQIDLGSFEAAPRYRVAPKNSPPA